jgi:phenylacetate-CoA ligase
LSEVIGPGVAAECLEAADGLHVNEDHFLVEAVDPETGAPVPDGTPGELVFSTMTREALPLLRYRTGDISALRRGTCACGRTLVRMSKVTGRRDDMLVLRGVNVYPSEVERVLLASPALCPDYLLVVDERGAAGRLIVCCEYKTAAASGSPSAAGPAGSGAGQSGAEAGQPGSGTGRPDSGVGEMPGPGELEARFRAELGVGVAVRVLPPGTLPRSEVGKAVRVVRWRDGAAPLPGLD